MNRDQGFPLYATGNSQICTFALQLLTSGHDLGDQAGLYCTCCMPCVCCVFAALPSEAQNGQEYVVLQKCCFNYIVQQLEFCKLELS